MSAPQPPARRTAASPERVERLIILLRGRKLILDFHLAELYDVPTKALNQAVKRNLERFPADFMFRLSAQETELVLRSHIVTSSSGSPSNPTKPALPNWSQIVTSSKKHRGLAYRPLAFTEQGVAMLSSVLNSPRAVQVNIEIMRAFVRLRRMLASNAELAGRLAALERKYDRRFKVVFEAIRQLMAESTPVQPARHREIGFHTIRSTSSGPIKMKTRVQLP